MQKENHVIRELKADLVRKDKAIEVRDEEIQRMLKLSQEQQLELDRKDEAILEIQEERRDAEKRAAQLKEANAELVRRDSEIEGLREAYDLMKKEKNAVIAAQVARVAELQTEGVNKENWISSMRKHLIRKNKRIDRLMGKFEAECKQLRWDRNEAQDGQDTNADRIDELEKELEETKTLLGQVRERASELEKDRDRGLVAIADQAVRILDLRQLLDQVNDIGAEAIKCDNKKARDLAEADEEIDMLRGVLGDRDTEILGLQGDMNTLRAALVILYPVRKGDQKIHVKPHAGSQAEGSGQ